MKYLNDVEMKKIIGGGMSLFGILGISSLVTFLSGIIDGFVRPLKCN